MKGDAETDFGRTWAAVALAFDPDRASHLGLAGSLRQSWGASPAAGMDALLGRETLAELKEERGFEAAGRLEAVVGYGMPVFTGTPELGLGLSEAGRDWRVGWKLGLAGRRREAFELNFDATRNQPANDDAPEHGVMLRGSLRW